MNEKEIKTIINELMKEIKKQPENLLEGLGSGLCPSNPVYYKKGYVQALKDLKIRIKIKEAVNETKKVLKNEFS